MEKTYFVPLIENKTILYNPYSPCFHPKCCNLSLDLIYNSINTKIFNIDLNSNYSNFKYRDVSSLKHIYCVIARSFKTQYKSYTYSLQKIADVIKRNHTIVVYAMREHNNRMNFDKSIVHNNMTYKELYLLSKKAVNDLL